MNKKRKKALVLLVKLAVAGLLLFLVGRLVHWHDYAVTAQGKQECPVFDAKSRDGVDQVEVKLPGSDERRWMPATDFRPISIETNGRWAPVLDARPDWVSPAEYLVQQADGGQTWMNVAELGPAPRQVVYRGLRSTLASAKPALLLVATLLFLGPIFIMATRWWYLLRIQQIHIHWAESVRLTFLGQFFSIIVPGTVSGDLIKAWYVAKHTDRKAAALVSVFVDRVVGLLEFALLPAIVIAAMLATGKGGPQLKWPAIVVAVVLLAVAAFMSLLLSPGLRRLIGLGRLITLMPRLAEKVSKHLQVAGEAADTYRRQLTSLLKALAITFGGQFFFITGIMTAGFALGLPVPWYQYFLYVPLIYIIASVPISPGALGVAEALYVVFLTPAGAAPSEALALALVARLIPMILSLPGIYVALSGPRLPKAAQMQAELENAP